MTALFPDIPGTEQPGSGAQPGQVGLSGAIGSFVIGESPIGGGGVNVAQLAGPGLPNILPAYLYMQYNDDENLQAFIDAFNQIAQSYLDWFNQIGLPIYTGDMIVGALLDWVAGGIYGEERPSLPSGNAQVLGPYGLLGFGDGPPYGLTETIGPSNLFVTTDDIFKRILTWHHFLGDGKVFSIRWLKRRVMRFLTGVNGTAPNIDQTYRISITFGTNDQINITLVNQITTLEDAAGYGELGFGSGPPCGVANYGIVPLPSFALGSVFKAAVEAGALELPTQYEWVVNNV
jgi:hypothetical protein